MAAHEAPEPFPQVSCLIGDPVELARERTCSDILEHICRCQTALNICTLNHIYERESFLPLPEQPFKLSGRWRIWRSSSREKARQLAEVQRYVSIELRSLRRQRKSRISIALHVPGTA